MTRPQSNVCVSAATMQSMPPYILCLRVALCFPNAVSQTVYFMIWHTPPLNAPVNASWGDCDRRCISRMNNVLLRYSAAPATGGAWPSTGAPAAVDVCMLCWECTTAPLCAAAAGVSADTACLTSLSAARRVMRS